jgi:hypothetical protein
MFRPDRAKWSLTMDRVKRTQKQLRNKSQKKEEMNGDPKISHFLISEIENPSYQI